MPFPVIFIAGIAGVFVFTLALETLTRPSYHRDNREDLDDLDDLDDIDILDDIFIYQKSSQVGNFHKIEKYHY